jgi:hypothetical protein
LLVDIHLMGRQRFRLFWSVRDGKNCQGSREESSGPLC